MKGFITGITEKYPKELLQGRLGVEANCVFSFWKNPSLFKDYKEITTEYFLTEDARFYFALGKQMSDLYNVFDEVSVISHLNNNEILMNGFNERGGYDTVFNAMETINDANVDQYIDVLNRENIFIKLHDEGFNLLNEITINEKQIVPLKLLRKMTAAETLQFYESRISSIGIRVKSNDMEISNLGIDDDFEEQLTSGMLTGIPFDIGGYSQKDGSEIKSSKILSKISMGINKGELTLIGGFSGSGKAQDLKSKIMTPNGYVKMEDIKVGDEIFGDDGEIYHVTGVFPQGMKDMYEVVFSDGSKTITCDEHLWNVQNPTLRTLGKYETLTLNEIMKKGLYKNYSGNSHKTWMHYIPMTKPLQFKMSEKLPIDPYLLGLLIGDGLLNDSSVCISINTNENDILQYVNNYCLENGYHLVSNNSKSLNCEDYRIVKNSGKINKLKFNLKELGLHPTVSDTKFIPKKYLFATIEERIELLSGLIDSDGEVNDSGYTYSTVSSQLARDVQFLVQSLGGTARISNRQTFYTYNGEKRKGKPSFRLQIKMPRDIQPFKSEKHKNKFKLGQTGARRTIREINYLGKREAQCISTSNPNQLYLTDDMIVTHNTSFTFSNIVMPMVFRGEKVCITANEQRKIAWQILLVLWTLIHHFKYYNLTRKKLKAGDFNEQDRKMIRLAKNFVNTNFKDNIKFIKTFDYNVRDIVREQKRLHLNEGYTAFIYDTFKAEDSSDLSSARGSMVEDSKMLFQFASKYNVPQIITAQLATYLEKTSWLSSQCLSSSKQVKEVCSEIFLMRKLINTIELDPKNKNYINPYELVKSDGKWVKKYFEIDDFHNGQYRIIFVDKTRNDEDSAAILYKYDGHINVWHELGQCTPSRIDFLR